MAFPEVESITESADTANTTTHTVDLPATVDDGDRLVLAVIATGTSVVATSDLDDWDLIATGTLFFAEWFVYTLEADGTEDGTSVDFTASSGQMSAQVYRIPGTADGLEDTAWNFAISPVEPANPAFTLNPDPPNVDADWGSDDNLFIAGFFAGANGGTVTANPTDYTPGADNNASASNWIGTAHRQLAAASADPGTFTIDDGTAGENVRAWTLVLRPLQGITATAERAVATTDARTADSQLGLVATAERAVATAVARQVDNPIFVTPERAVATARANQPFAVSPPLQAPQFPAARLGLRVEMAFGADNSSPLDWVWTDVSDRLLAESAMSARSGRADESAETQPSTVSLVLDNGDGALMPNNAGSPFWPNVKRGTPLRIWVEGRQPALYLPGIDGSFASTPSDPEFDFAGDFEVRMRVQPDQWADPASGEDDNQILVSRAGGPATDFGWRLELRRDGKLRAAHSVDGTTVIESADSTSRVAALRPAWLGQAYTADNGDSGRTITYYSFEGDGDPPGDITDWKLLGSAITATASPVFASGADIQLGALAGVASFQGRVLELELRDETGTLVANPDFTAQTPGTEAFFDGVGKVWTLSGDARIATERARFVGRVDEIAPTWPYRDHNPTGSGNPTEARVEVTASGLLRRLSQGAKPLRSAMFRIVTAVEHPDPSLANPADEIYGYWPCEDASGAARFATPIPDADPIVVTGDIGVATDNTLDASAPLPTIASGEIGSWAVAVPPPPGGSSTSWVVSMLLRVPTPETNPTTTQLIEIDCLGTAAKWTLLISDTFLTVRALDDGGVQIGNVQIGIPSTHFGPWIHAELECEDQLDGTVSFFLTLRPLDFGARTTQGSAVFGTLGRVTNLSNTAAGPADGLSFGHLYVRTLNLDRDWAVGATSAWVGESAANRFHRLCREESIPVEIIGDGELLPLKGDLTLSEPMGPQLQKTLLALLNECATTDLGVVLSRRAIPGLIYRTRKTLEAQPVRLTLDAGANEITAPINPRLDDQRLRNDVTVTTAGGSSARALDQVSIDSEGLYEEDVEIFGVGGLKIQTAILVDLGILSGPSFQPGLADAVDDQNLQQAAWRLHLGTWPDMRYPTVAIDLGKAPQLIEAWQDVELGDRIVVTGLPVQHPNSDIELLIEAIDEALTPDNWIPVLTCSPGGPWLIGVLDA